MQLKRSSRRPERCAVHACNVTREEEVKNLAETVFEIRKRINILINNAGMLIRKEFEETTEEEWDEVMATNLKGPFFCCKHIIPQMVRNKRGSVVNISSHVSLVGKGDVPCTAPRRAE